MKKFFERLNSTERRFVAVVAVVVFIVLNILFILPRFNDWTAYQARMNRAGKTLGDFQKEVTQTNFYVAEIRKLGSEGAAVPAEDQSVQFSGTIQSEAVRNQVLLVSVNPQAPRGTNLWFIEKVMAVSTQSGEKQLLNFLYNLGAGTSLIRVREIALRRDPSGFQLSSNIKLVASYQKKIAARSPAPATNAPAAKPASASAKPATPVVKPSVTATNKPPATSPAKPTTPTTK